MINPMQYWSDLWAFSLSMGRSASQIAEIAEASNRVIGRRSEIIADAMQDPLNGDYDELGKMVPEKLEAFGAAGQAMMKGVAASQGLMLANMQAMAGMAMGHAPSVSSAMSLAQRNAKAMREAGRTVEQSIAPIHALSTANDRRLAKTRRTRSR